MDSLSSYVRSINMDATKTSKQTARETIYDIASYADSLLSLLVTPTLKAYRERDKETARAIPEYAELEQTRDTELGRSFDVTMKMIRIEHSVSDKSTFRSLLQKMNNNPILSLTGRIDSFLQRGKKGWSDSDLTNMDTYLAEVIGSQLLHFADTTHGWPASEEYPDFTDWQNALRENGHKLLAYAGRETREENTILPPSEWLKAEDARYQSAKEALEWVARNLPALWD